MAISIIIPAYQPDLTLLDLISEIRILLPVSPIIIVNDGSGHSCRHIFKKLAQQGAIVLEHSKNLGKGAALQTAFEYWDKNFSSSQEGVVTADADGQHQPSDIALIANELSNAPNALHLGTRQFGQGRVPLRSQIGNQLTALLFRLFSRISINDTQTGLRGIGTRLIRNIKNSQAKGYEFEMEMLIRACLAKIDIKQHPIKTIYFDDNLTSHFNPILDSIKVYKVFLKYFGSIIKK